MKEKVWGYWAVMIFVLVVSLLVGTGVQAGSKDLAAEKRVKFTDDSVESLRDVFKQREEKEKEYREKMLANSTDSIKLLKEIRNLLQQLNEKMEVKEELE